ncbi:GTPase-activating protein gyp3 [Nannizzia gypsea CBS 118893]|uniref:GTPase-activating protein gyp3 n=1 Tax=Arthroderma gypseum (strain ATCC MYA-4604 / CBS 118893) TaxID=535722 RepID=E4V4X5_ARTGP|nr:GTPase-activating protein gyp3 [Nannizzia gypsea CBS 118893]EFR05049.1 GTPase-activating protein gyp3 [Nannizzia gypsea CBS 118893]
MITQRGGPSADSRRPSAADIRTASQQAPSSSSSRAASPAVSAVSAASLRQAASPSPSVRQRHLHPRHPHAGPNAAAATATVPSYAASVTESPVDGAADQVWPASPRSGSPAATAPASGLASGHNLQHHLQHHQHQPFQQQQQQQQQQHRYYQRPYSPQPRLKPSPSMPNVRQKSYSPFQADRPSPRSSPMALSPSRSTHRYYTPELHFDIPPPSRTSLQSSMTVTSSIEQTSGTERSSVVTKTSSTTELSPKISEEDEAEAEEEDQYQDQYQDQDRGRADQGHHVGSGSGSERGGAGAGDQGTHGYGEMSVDDAIDMYLDGFTDDSSAAVVSPAKRKSAVRDRLHGSPDISDIPPSTPPDSPGSEPDHEHEPEPEQEPESESVTPANFNSADFNFNFAPEQPGLEPEPEPEPERALAGDSDNSPSSPRPQTALPSPSPSPPPRPPSASMQPPAHLSALPAIIDASINSEPPPLLKPTKTRDQYGFRKATTHVTVEQYDSWHASYAEYQKIRSEKWYALLRASGIDEAVPTTFPIRSAKLKKYIRKGIPPECRGAAWFCPMNDDKEHIERDLHRTFPDNVHYKPDSSDDDASSGSSNLKHRSASPDTPIIQSLRRVLYAFSLHNSNIGYTQSLNFIAGFLILFLPEEKAFWLLHIITSSFFPGTHEISLEGANADLWILMVALKESLPSVYTKVVSTTPTSARAKPPTLTTATRLPDITLGLTNWLMSMFISTLPFETTLRVWDVLFYEGSRTFFRVALSIFRMSQKQIVSLGDPMEIFQVVQTAPKRMIDPNELMMDCFARRFKLSQARVESLRQARRAAIREGKDRLSQLAGPRKFKTDPSARPSTGATNHSPSAWRSFKSFKQ